MKAKDLRLTQIKRDISEVSPTDALALQKDGAALVDIRETEEIAQGSPVGSLRVTRGYLELRIEEMVPEFDHTILVMCGGGTRSLFACEALKRMGYKDVRSVQGGFNGWKNNGLSFEIPQLLDKEARERYSRHLLMPEVGETGQQKLLNAKVLIVGAGGLGSPAGLYLACAGVGHLGVVDHDIVDRSNLQRQVLHSDESVGIPKVESAKKTLRQINPSIEVTAIDTQLESRNVEDILLGYDVVLDGSDNFPTRYLINDACVKLGIPNVHGAVYRFEGQVSVFWPAHSDHRGPCYRCLFPEPPPAEMAPSCAEAGVLGILPGVIGLLQAVETLKIILNLGEILVGRMLYYDALRARFTQLKVPRRESCPYCGDGATFPGYIDYEQFCASANS